MIKTMKSERPHCDIVVRLKNVLKLNAQRAMRAADQEAWLRLTAGWIKLAEIRGASSLVGRATPLMLWHALVTIELVILVFGGRSTQRRSPAFGAVWFFREVGHPESEESIP
jgi:hypothetical protein